MQYAQKSFARLEAAAFIKSHNVKVIKTRFQVVGPLMWLI